MGFDLLSTPFQTEMKFDQYFLDYSKKNNGKAGSVSFDYQCGVMMPPPRHHHLDGWTNNNNNNMVNIKNFPLLDVAAWLHIKIYSSTHVIEVELYKEFCAETKKVILTAFNENEESWIYLTPSVHALL